MNGGLTTKKCNNIMQDADLQDPFARETAG